MVTLNKLYLLYHVPLVNQIPIDFLFFTTLVICKVCANPIIPFEEVFVGGKVGDNSVYVPLNQIILML